MVFKLKDIKSKIVLITSCLLISCGTYKRDKFEYHFGDENNKWINMFKTRVYFSCIQKGYKDKNIFELISREDLMVPYDPIYFEYGKIDTLTAKIIKNIPKPIYPNCDDCSEEEQQEIIKKNYICATCLNYYASRELDSIAKAAYKKYQKTE
jgi:hypothetical protein